MSRTLVLLVATVCGGLALAACSGQRLRRMSRGGPTARPADDRVDLDARMHRTIARFGKCTATHVGRGYFLTAGHCVREDRGFEGYRSSPCPHALGWGEDEGGPCTVELYRYDDEHDYALLRLKDPSLSDGLPLAPIDYQFDWKKMRQRPLVVAGYSKGTLQKDARCSGSIATDTLVKHDCTTEPGDSGSALVDKETMHVIGVHGGALDSGANYGCPVQIIPWAQSLCVAETSSEPIPIEPGGAPAVFKVSTSHTGGAFGRLSVALTGSLAKADLQVRIFHPDGELVVDTSSASFTWSGERWAWNDLYELDEGLEGPWSVEISSAAQTTALKRRGHVEGQILVCP